MAGYGVFLYRLLRDDEYPLTDGIMAKYPSRDKEPSYHIRQCSSEYKACHWISTCASEEGLGKMIGLKKRKKDDEVDNDICVRYVVINRSKLETYAKICNEREACKDYTYVLEVFEDRIVRTVPFREQTGRILDFTDSNVMEKYLPKLNPCDKKYQIQRNYAQKYEEVLVERFIPPHCCIEVIPCDEIPLFSKNEIGKKEFVSLREWTERCQNSQAPPSGNLFPGFFGQTVPSMPYMPSCQWYWTTYPQFPLTESSCQWYRPTYPQFPLTESSCQWYRPTYPQFPLTGSPYMQTNTFCIGQTRFYMPSNPCYCSPF